MRAQSAKNTSDTSKHSRKSNPELDTVPDHVFSNDTVIAENYKI